MANTGSGGSSQKPVFVRQATGLVREVGFWGTLGTMVGFQTILGAICIGLPSIAAVTPGADFVWGFVAAWLIQLVTVFAYSYLSISMSRSGGDYVWVSRVVHPSLGFMSGSILEAAQNIYESNYTETILAAL